MPTTYQARHRSRDAELLVVEDGTVLRRAVVIIRTTAERRRTSEVSSDFWYFVALAIRGSLEELVRDLSVITHELLGLCVVRQPWTYH